MSYLHAFESGLVIGGAVGPHMGGEIDTLTADVPERWRIRHGVVASLTLARRFLGTKPAVPFLLVVGTFSGSSTSTVRERDGARTGLHAIDFKGDLSLGWTIGETFSPYVAVRAFGGPVFWKPEDEAITGTDLYHVSGAAGFNLTMGNRVSVFFDGAFVGMRGVSGGASVRF